MNRILSLVSLGVKVESSKELHVSERCEDNSGVLNSRPGRSAIH